MKHVHLEQSPREGLGEGYKQGACDTVIRTRNHTDNKQLPKRDDSGKVFEKIQHARLSTSTTYVRKSSSSAKERQRAERQQLTRLLKESPGKRDARNFLKQFDAPKKGKAAIAVKAKELVSPGVTKLSSGVPVTCAWDRSSTASASDPGGRVYPSAKNPLKTTRGGLFASNGSTLR